MTKQTENLQEPNNDASITASAEGNTADSAAAQAAEDTHPADPRDEIINQQNATIDTHPADPRDEIINQQNATIDTLLKRTEELTGQINKLISMGVQITDEPTPEETQSINNTTPEDYVPLKDLGAEIGKHDRY